MKLGEKHGWRLRGEVGERKRCLSPCWGGRKEVTRRRVLRILGERIKFLSKKTN